MFDGVGQASPSLAHSIRAERALVLGICAWYGERENNLSFFFRLFVEQQEIQRQTTTCGQMGIVQAGLTSSISHYGISCFGWGDNDFTN